jgi:hypothetical protein
MVNYPNNLTVAKLDFNVMKFSYTGYEIRLLDTGVNVTSGFRNTF